ncbi:MULTISPECIES: SecY-interacting protein [unclassified Vibrio]|uniref:Protein Syd n=1 Tax=Vibrio sp. HB236076 TaxID=3232307 RepID=A0AB39HAT8_9VIBR|nr:SecY-interacting protein [Vibrio sp. HB161653]MDP5254197.1 SecY-interacting protein [Vibrio sp. HB161653]
MTHSVSDALRQLHHTYYQSCQRQTGHSPYCDETFVDWPSPCIERIDNEKVYWQAQPQQSEESLFDGVENALELTLHPDIKAFYSAFFAGDITLTIEQQAITLLQVWNREDIERLQENMIGHLLMQKRLKQTPTVFIGTTEDEHQVISICNLSGEVLLETLGKKQRRVLADNLVNFLTRVEPLH